jgi:hypothetical protein
MQWRRVANEILIYFGETGISLTRLNELHNGKQPHTDELEALVRCVQSHNETANAGEEIAADLINNFITAAEAFKNSGKAE